MHRMIALLTGELAAVTPEHIIIDINGVGYEVQVANRTRDSLPALGGALRLHIHTHVREDQLVLFGFSAVEERTLFLRLLSVSGVGPKLALTILSHLSPAELVSTVVDENSAGLKEIPGIGKKTAERIVIDLRDRLLRDHANLLQLPGSTIRRNDANADALSALVNLGYNQNIAEQALQKLNIDISEVPVDQVIRQALQQLAKH